MPSQCSTSRSGLIALRHFITTLAATFPAGLAVCVTPAWAGSDIGRFSIDQIEAKGVDLAVDRDGLRLSMPRQFWQDPAKQKLADRNFMALLPIDFADGTIEAEIKSEIDEQAPDFARGFVGFAFRVAADSFEKIYLRPTNGVANDQVRRNHSVQYAAYPDYRFDRLRLEAPERYETAADIAPNRWIHMKIIVLGATAKLYLDHRPNPVLVVNDLKLGAGRRGRVGLWIETGTIAHFRSIKVIPVAKQP